MTDAMGPGEFDEWMAADELDNLLGNEYLIRLLELCFATLCNGVGMPSVTPKHFRLERMKHRAQQRDRGQEHADAFAAVAATHNASFRGK